MAVFMQEEPETGDDSIIAYCILSVKTTKMFVVMTADVAAYVTAVASYVAIHISSIESLHIWLILIIFNESRMHSPEL